MGTTNQIQETNITLELADKSCDQCSQIFTQQDLDNQNWEVYFDTTNKVNLEPLLQGYYFSIVIRSIEHQECPK